MGALAVTSPVPWWPVSTTLSSPGDRLWSEWLPAETTGLPVALVGPVPETAYVAPSPGAFVPFPDREPDLFIDAPDWPETGLGLSGLSSTAPSSTAARVLREALNPLPPMQRIAPIRPTRPTPAPAPARRASGGPACASCTSSVVELRKWGPCAECLQPVCSECLLESMAVVGRGWCATCVAETRTDPGSAS